MLRYRSLNLAAFCLFIFSCSKPLPTLEGFDQQTWKADKNGCEQKRSSMVQVIQSEKHKLLALDEMQIVDLLGKPDRNELFTRNQKFFYYFIEPAPDCVEHSDNAARLIIRFNAMGLSKEVNIE